MLVKPQVNTQEDVQVQSQEEEVMTTPEVETTEVAVAEAQPQEEQSTSVTARQAAGIQQFQQEQAEQGFEGLEVGAFSFERVKLHEGRFLKGDNDEDLGTEFEFIAMTSRSSYIVRQGNFQDAEVFYSYSPDGSTLTDGSSSKEITDKWLEDGYGTKDEPLDIRKYLEVMAEIVSEDHNNGSIVNLNIPPTSLQRFGGTSMIAKARFGAPNLSYVVLKASVGAKVGEGNKAFRPWNFTVVRKNNM